MTSGRVWKHELRDATSAVTLLSVVLKQVGFDCLSELTPHSGGYAKMLYKGQAMFKHAFVNLHSRLTQY